MAPKKLAGRYEIKEVLGEGGMGLVYRAYDTVIRRDIALKTLRDIPEPTALQMFYKECDVLASMSHPNIVEIFDLGEFEEDGKLKPYFVMPLLSGGTLDSLIKNASHRLTVDRTIEIVAQACRGLQAAHERGLIHRDLKPSNIFVMQDDSVKIIDFGVAHIADAHTTIGQKGTLLYMSPEQIEMKPLSALSDIFSLSVVAYEALTGRQPFRRSRADEVAEAILRLVPPPASDLNSAINDSISRVVHKGMAKQPWHRFSTARDFGDTLSKALRNEPIEFFDKARLRPRLERATKALEEEDYQFAGEILGELEAEGHIDTSIGLLRQQLDRAVRQRTIAKLLESAKSRFEEEEDPLALQKVQEILQLDSTNVGALGLKSRIENRRSERQIESWYHLASQHIANHAYVHAREALQNVLQLKPKEERALQLVREIDRLEQDYNKLRQEKVALHRAAMDAWQKGEVSTALTKLAVVLELDRRAPDSVNPERSAGYQSLYNQVRSEHDAINNGYAEARKHLADKNFAKALTLCDTFLKKYSNNALFQALKFDVEEQQRQDLSAFIATIDRRVEGEADLDKRVNILKEALALYPEETHFQRALRLIQDKRDLVNSIVSRAHLHEEQGSFHEAVGDWEILRTIYGQYPGLNFELERLQKRREQQSRVDAKNRWVQQVDDRVRSGEHAAALELLRQAQGEFPDDPELGELENLVRDSMQRAARAQELITEGEDLCEKNRFPEGIKLLRQAYELDHQGSIARAVLANALVEQARTLLDTNWQEAEGLIQQTLDLIPSHPQAKSMRTLISDRKREQFVNENVSHARRLRAAADLAGALAHVEEGLAVYQNEGRLVQMQHALQKELAESDQRKARRRDLEELRRLERHAETTRSASATRVFNAKAKELANTYPDDPDFLSVLRDLQRAENSEGVGPVSRSTDAPPSQQADQATMIFAPPGARKPSPALESTTPSVRKGKSSTISEARQQGASKPGKISQINFAKIVPFFQKVAQQISWQRLQTLPLAGRIKTYAAARPREAMALGASAFLLLGVIIVAAIWLSGGHTTQVLKTGEFTVRIHVSPPEAIITVNGTVQGSNEVALQLPSGNYQIEARLPGYETATASLEVKTESPAPVELTLTPTASALRLTADTASGQVSLDGAAPADLSEAQWDSDRLSAGEHHLKFTSPRGSVSFAFISDPGALPAVNGPITSRGVQAVVVTGLGSRVRVYSSRLSAKLSLDDGATVDLSGEGVELTDVSPGAHKITVMADDEEHSLDIEVKASPTLSAFITSAENVGTLVIATGEDNVLVFLNKKPYGETKNGQLRIPNLKPQQYEIRVTKVGFQDATEQAVTLRKGEQKRVPFSLQPVVKLAALSIEGALPGTEVLIDQTSVGTVTSDGSLRTSVNPGDHVIELRKDRLRPKRLQKRFAAGSTVSLSSAEVALDVTLGEIRVAFSPADAEVLLNKPGLSPEKVTNGATLRLSPGSYVLLGRVGNGPSRTYQIEVAADKTKSIELFLAPGGMSDWDLPEGGWRPEKNYYVRRGGNLVFYKIAPTSGTFVFSTMLTKGRRLQWVLNYQDSGNYLLFQMDENSFYRSLYVNGQATDEVQIPHKTDKKAFRTFQITVSPSQITHQIWNGNSWMVLDTYARPNTNLSLGRFGFNIPSNDEVLLTNFAHYRDPRVR